MAHGSRITGPEDQRVIDAVEAVREAGGNITRAAEILSERSGTRIARNSMHPRLKHAFPTREQLDAFLAECRTNGDDGKPAGDPIEKVKRKARENPWTDMSEAEVNGAIRLLLRQGGNADGPDQVNAVREQISRNGLPIEALAEVEKIKLYEQGQKGPDGEPVKMDLVSTWLKPGGGLPAWPVVQQVPPIVIKPTKSVEATVPTGWRRALIVPDMQIGYWRRPDNTLMPMHDESALDVLFQVARDMHFDACVAVGDNNDFPEHGRYRKSPAFATTTQAALNRRAQVFAQLRANLGPEASIDDIEGNHDARLPYLLLDNAISAFGIRRAELGDSLPDDWPVMTIPHLCRYEEIGVRYHEGYPGSRVRLNDNLVCVHGDKVRSNGSTGPVYLDGERHSIIYGHLHRIERTERTKDSIHGPRTYGAYCFGCLCRTDGVVPSAKTGFDRDGLPVGSAMNWQQGFGIVEYEPGAGRYSIEQVHIWNGWARVRGKDYFATVDVEGKAISRSA